MDKVNKFSAIGLLILCTVVYGLTVSFPPKVAIYPRILIIVLAGLSLILLLTNLKPKQGEEKQQLGIKNLSLVTAVTVISLVYISLINIFGYYILTPIYLAVIMWLMKMRDKKKLVFISIGFMVLVFIVFRLLLKIPIPKGTFLSWR